MPGGKPGEGVQPKRLGTKARLDGLIDVLRRKRQTEGEFVLYWFILNAAYTKESPNKPTGNVTESLAEQMGLYLQDQGYLRMTRMPTKSLAWGTFAETCAAKNDIVTKVRICIDSRAVLTEEVEAYVSTNLGHMPRVWLCWFFLKPKGWKVHFVFANHSFTLKEYFQETTKFFQYLYRFAFKKW